MPPPPRPLSLRGRACSAMRTAAFSALVAGSAERTTASTLADTIPRPVKAVPSHQGQTALDLSQHIPDAWISMHSDAPAPAPAMRFMKPWAASPVRQALAAACVNTGEAPQPRSPAAAATCPARRRCGARSPAR